jgi:hypothetical protein
MATAAQGSLPGEALYPVKRGIEKAAVSLSGSKVGQGRELLSQAGDRLHEVDGLLEGGAADRAQIPSTLEDFHAEARKGAALMVESYESTDNPRTMMFLRSFAARNLGTVESLDGAAPSDAQPALRDAALLLRSIVSQADQLCPTCWQPPELQSATMYPASAGSAQARHELRTVDPVAPNDDHSLLLEEASDPTVGLPGDEVAATDPGVLGPSSAPDPTGGPDVTDGGEQEPAASVGGGDPTGVEPGPSPTGDGAVPSSPPASDPVETGTDPGAGPSDDPSSQPSGDQGGTEGDPSSTGAEGDPSAQSDAAGGGSEETATPQAAHLDASVVP